MTSETVAAEGEDLQLRLHKKVDLTWTRNGLSYSGRGQIVALGRRLATVELLYPVGHNHEYATGDLLQVPRYAEHFRWSSDCRMRKIAEKPFIHKDFL